MENSKKKKKNDSQNRKGTAAGSRESKLSKLSKQVVAGAVSIEASTGYERTESSKQETQAWGKKEEKKTEDSGGERCNIPIPRSPGFLQQAILHDFKQERPRKEKERMPRIAYSSRMYCSIRLLWRQIQRRGSCLPLFAPKLRILEAVLGVSWNTWAGQIS